MGDDMRNLAIALGLASAAMSSHALAADPVVPEDIAIVAPAPGYDWTGFYVGGHLGWVWDDADWTNAEGNWWGGIGTGTTIDSDGFLGGGQIGYMHQLQNNWVLGAEISAAYTDLDQSIASPTFPAIDTWTVGVDWLLLAQARVGYAHDRYLAYIQGGYAGADATASALPILGGGTATQSNWHDGWTIGGGFSYMATSNISIGAEYNYVDLGTERYDLLSTLPTDLVDIDHTMHTAKFTINFHFGGQ